MRRGLAACFSFLSAAPAVYRLAGWTRGPPGAVECTRWSIPENQARREQIPCTIAPQHKLKNTGPYAVLPQATSRHSVAQTWRPANDGDEEVMDTRRGRPEGPATRRSVVQVATEFPVVPFFWLSWLSKGKQLPGMWPVLGGNGGKGRKSSQTGVCIW